MGSVEFAAETRSESPPRFVANRSWSAAGGVSFKAEDVSLETTPEAVTDDGFLGYRLCTDGL
jgi:hypothetical protein